MDHSVRQKISEKGTGLPAKIGLILNPRAGTSGQAGELAQMFASQALPVTIYEAANPVEAARQAVAEGAGTLIAAGGDGTINAVVSVIVASKPDAVLGVLPAGTLNHFAKALQIPLDLEQAVAVIAQGNTSFVDVGEVNGRVFINNSSLGLYPTMVVLRRSHEKRGWSRWVALLRAFIMSVRRLPAIHLRLTAGERRIDRRTPMVFVGNNEYEMEGVRAGLRDRLDTGRLYVCIATASSSMGLLYMILLALFRRLKDHDEFEAFSATEALVESRRRLIRVSLDGEVTLMKTPLHYRIRPGSLRVLSP